MLSNITLNESKCKGIVQQGPRKGMQCQRDKTENGYCIYHQRNYEYDNLTSLGKNLCNGFFRGCNNELSSDDLKHDLKFCSSCRIKKSGKQFPCKFNGCLAKIKNEEDKYCDKHVRELLRDNEKEKNIQYCDISRGCFNILTDDIKCSSCRNKEKQKATNEMAALRKFYGIILPERKDTDELFEKQELISFQIKEVWRNVQRNAMLKSRLFTLSQQDFEKLIIQPCYYCGFYSNSKFLGIDRIDNTKGYILSNCVPSCKMCNMMKNVDHPCAFLDKVNLICDYRQNHNPIYNKITVKWPSYLIYGAAKSYNEYKNISEKHRNIKFLLTQSQYEILIHRECYLCGIRPMEGHRNGIDRYDNNEDYTLENSRTCCGHCNKMKRNYIYEDFIRKCIQIKSHNCDRTNFIPILPDSSKLDHEYYTAEDIAKFLQDGHLTKFLEWCEEKKKSAEFKSAITYIASKLENTIVEQIRKELDNERARKLNHSKNPDKKHLHCATIYAWLSCGNDHEFLEWFTKQYEKTALFDRKFKELKNDLPCMNREDGIKACKKFMYDEKSRRNSQKIRDEKSRNIVNYSSQILDPIKINERILQFEDTIAKNVITRQVNENKEFNIPKQWKVKDIYNIIMKKNEEIYYNYLKENNSIDFEKEWSVLLINVKGKSYNESEPIIKNFIQCLRNIRHNKLCAEKNSKKALEKEDRHHYRADGVLIILKTKSIEEIAKFKSYTESYTGDNPEDPKWVKRWDSFIASVENEVSEETKKSIISKFLASQRKKKNDRKNK